MGGASSAAGTGMGARGAGWAGGIGVNSSDCAAGHGGIYGSCSWDAACDWHSGTRSASWVVRGATWNVQRYSSLAGVNLPVVEVSRWSTMIGQGFGE